MKSLKEKKGITLVALVITIIILLILARINNKYDNRKWIIWKSRRSKNKICRRART